MTTTMTEVDLARIAVAVEDNALRYVGGPFNFGRDDAVRYVSEGHLKRYPFREVWDHVAAYIDAHPEVLTYTPTTVAANQQRRAEQCEGLARDAHEAMTEADIPDALAAVDDGERIDPDYRVAGRHSWDALREAINARRPVCERCKEPVVKVDRDFGLCPGCEAYNGSRVVV